MVDPAGEAQQRHELGLGHGVRGGECSKSWQVSLTFPIVLDPCIDPFSYSHVLIHYSRKEF
jgi:hypothetical protein